MATITVTTANDVVNAGDGVLSLREAVAQANATATAADTILFAAGLEGQTLQLTGGQIAITRDLTIDGDANNDGSQVALDAGGLDRHFAISGAATDVALRDLVLVDRPGLRRRRCGVGHRRQGDAGRSAASIPATLPARAAPSRWPRPVP